MSGYIPRPPTNESWSTGRSKVGQFLSRPRQALGQDRDKVPIGHNFLVDGQAVERISHTSMSGGAYLVDQQYLKYFNGFLVHDLQQMNVLPPLTEIHTPLFPMFFDVDLKIERQKPVPEFARVVAGIIQDVIHQFYPRGPTPPSSDSPDPPDSSEPPVEVGAWFRVLVCTKHVNSFQRTATASIDDYREETCQAMPLKRVSEWEEVVEEDTTRSRILDPPDALAEKIWQRRLSPGCTDGVIRLASGDVEGHEMQVLHIASDHVLVVRNRDSETGEETSHFFRPRHRLWKHGLHIHVPDLVVNVYQAALLRRAVVDTLKRRNRYLAALLHKDDGSENHNIDWDEVIDEAVYRHNLKQGGLRLVGAPKAERCRMKHVVGEWCPCQSNGGRIIDPSYYWPKYLFQGKSERGKAKRIQVPHGGTVEAYREMIRMTTVRCCVEGSQGTHATPGWVDQPGYRIHERSIWNPNREGHQGPAFKPSKEETALARRRDVNGGRGSKEFLTDDAFVNDNRKIAAIRKILTSFGNDPRSKNYANVTIRARGNGERIIVSLTGEGAGFCLNKGGHHTNANVFMHIEREKTKVTGTRRRGAPPKYVAILKCYSKKKVIRPGGNVYCQNFHPSDTIKDERIVQLLFPMSDPLSVAGQFHEKRRLDVLSAANREASVRSRPTTASTASTTASTASTTASSSTTVSTTASIPFLGDVCTYEEDGEKVRVTVVDVRHEEGRPVEYTIRLPNGETRDTVLEALSGFVGQGPLSVFHESN